jgi:hypothetical protein
MRRPEYESSPKMDILCNRVCEWLRDQGFLLSIDERGRNLDPKQLKHVQKEGCEGVIAFQFHL